MFNSMKKTALFVLILTLSACSMWPSEKKVINLSKAQLDQKSYAIAYETTVASYQGKVNQDYDVNSFASGAKDWFSQRILVPVTDIKNKLGQGLNSDIHAYYSGVVFAADLQQNFSRLGKNCWEKIERPSLSQGIYDAMLDLRSGKDRSQKDNYIIQGSEMFLKMCQ